MFLIDFFTILFWLAFLSVVLTILGDKHNITALPEFFGVLAIFLLIIGIIWAPSVFVSQYINAIYLPKEIHQKRQAIEESKALLIKVNNKGSVGSGLEALKLKEKITTLIDEKNKKLASYNGKMEDPWVFFKPRAIPKG